MPDGEDGFGNAVNVAPSVKELEAAGVSAIEIEDVSTTSRGEKISPVSGARARRLKRSSSWLATGGWNRESPLWTARVALRTSPGRESFSR